MPRLLTIFNQNRENNAGDIKKFAGDNRQCASEKKILWILAFSVCNTCVWVFWLWYGTTFFNNYVLLFLVNRACRIILVENLELFREKCYFLQLLSFTDAGTPQSLQDSLLIRLRSSLYLDQPSKDMILKRQCILYLRYNLTYIDTRVFILIPALPDAREDISGKVGITQFSPLYL